MTIITTALEVIETELTENGERQINAFLHRNGPIDAIGVESTDPFGTEFGRILRGERFAAMEVMRPNRQHCRLKGKSDPIDALQSAMTVLAGRGWQHRKGETPKPNR